MSEYAIHDKTECAEFRKQMAKRTDTDTAWNGVYKGKTWKDMPGKDSKLKKFEFYLYRKDLLELD